VRSLREGSAPLGICWDAADLEGFETRPYRCDHLAAVVQGSHPLAKAESCDFAQTLEYDHVGMPAQTAVQTMLTRHAAILNRQILYRAVVSTFDAALRCVRANLGIAILPAEIARPIASALNVRVIPLQDSWARRRFAICFRQFSLLSPTAQLLVEHLETAAAAVESQGATSNTPAAKARGKRKHPPQS